MAIEVEENAIKLTHSGGGDAPAAAAKEKFYSHSPLNDSPNSGN